MKKSIYFVLVLVCGGITALSAIHLQKKLQRTTCSLKM